MAGNSSAYIVATFAISLFLSSLFISYFAISIYGYNLDVIQLPSEIESYPSEQNFAAGTYNLSTLDKTGNTGWTYYNKIGMVLTSLGAQTNYFLIDNIQLGSDKTITNTYAINNSVRKDYTIVLRYTGGYNNNEIQVKSDGFHIPYYYPVGNIQMGDSEFIPYVNANQYTDVKIVTTYYDGDAGNKVNGKCDFTFNGKTYTFTKLFYDKQDESGFYGSRFYGGVKSDSIGFTFQSFKTDSVISGSGANDSGSLAMISSMLSAMVKLVTWGLPEEILPLTLQLLFIRTQEAVLLIGIAGMIRGI